MVFDAVTGALTGLAASFVDGGNTYAVQNVAITRDGSQRVTGVADLVQGFADCFTYDAANRLGSAWSEDGAGCGTSAPASTDGTFDGRATGFATGWSYSVAGKILSVVNGVDAPITTTYAYTDAAHPAAVTGVDDGTSSASYTYDPAGRLVSRTVDTVTTDFVWDASSNLVESDGAGGRRVCVYDASGQRVAQVELDDPATSATFEGVATVYLGASEATDPDTRSNRTGDVTATRSYILGGATVA